MHRSIIFSLVMLLIASPAFATKVYKKTDPSGAAVYSDKPMEDSEEITLPDPQTYSSKPFQSAIDELSSQSTEQNEVIKKEYKVAILMPKNDQVIGKDIETLEVKVLVEPQLQPNHLVQLYVNDKPYKSPQKQTEFSMTNMNRGTYQIKAVVLDAKKRDTILKESGSVQIHVQRAKISANNPFRDIKPDNKS